MLPIAERALEQLKDRGARVLPKRPKDCGAHGRAEKAAAHGAHESGEREATCEERVPAEQTKAHGAHGSTERAATRGAHGSTERAATHGAHEAARRTHSRTRVIVGAGVVCLVALAAVLVLAAPTSFAQRESEEEIEVEAPVENLIDEALLATLEDPYSYLRDLHNADYTGVDEGETREVVCWGDSLTLGSGAGKAVVTTSVGKLDVSYMSYPAILQRLCGIKTYNYGISGATSREIVFMQRGYGRELLSSDSAIYDEGVASVSADHPGDVLILEIGSNGGWGGSYQALISQYKQMIAYAGCDNYLILGDTDDPGTSYADENQEAFEEGTGAGKTIWEAALENAFGEHFVNTRVFLVENGLTVTGLRATQADRTLASRGCVSKKLRADWTHLNSYGYYAKALAV